MSDTPFQDYVTPIPASWLNDVNDHTYNSTPIAPATTVHPASVIANTPAGTIAATTVQAAIDELSGDVTTAQATADNHIADTSAAHAASAIANTPAGTIAATNVQTALNELDTEKAAVSGTLAQFAATTSAQLAGVISDATGSGALVFSISPSLVTPALGTPSSGVLNNCTFTNKIAQQVYSQTGAVATGTTQIPADDTIPQNTEGDQYLSVSITPVSSTSILRIEVVVTWAHTTGGAQFTTALFQDTTANALAAIIQQIDNINLNYNNVFTHTMTSGTTSATTFKVRMGAASAGTTTFNGVGGARKLGGVLASSITVTEYLP